MVGLGFRKDFASEFLESNIIKPDFIEVAPENWVGIGGYWKKQLHKALEQYPLYTHGLSLSIGSPDELDVAWLKKVKAFLDETGAKVYSEHLSFSSCNNAHLYDLLPIPFTHDAVKHVAKKITQVQDILERPLVMEIVSYYAAIQPEMSELEFINAIVAESGCQLLLDVNNIYVNSFNHQYNPYEFLDQLPLDKVNYIHIAGHRQVADDLIIDTHGEAIADPVYKLLAHALPKLKPNMPILLERDFNIPAMEELQSELNQIKSIEKQTQIARGVYV